MALYSSQVTRQYPTRIFLLPSVAPRPSVCQSRATRGTCRSHLPFSVRYFVIVDGRRFRRSSWRHGLLTCVTNSGVHKLESSLFLDIPCDACGSVTQLFLVRHGDKVDYLCVPPNCWFTMALFYLGNPINAHYSPNSVNIMTTSRSHAELTTQSLWELARRIFSILL